MEQIINLIKKRTELESSVDSNVQEIKAIDIALSQLAKNYTPPDDSGNGGDGGNGGTDPIPPSDDLSHINEPKSINMGDWTNKVMVNSEADFPDNLESNTAYVLAPGITIREKVIQGHYTNLYIGTPEGAKARFVHPVFMNLWDDCQNINLDNIEALSPGSSGYNAVMGLGVINGFNMQRSLVHAEGSYNYYLIKMKGNGITFFNNVLEGSRDDIIYSGTVSNLNIVRNHISKANMKAANSPGGSGDCIQLEGGNQDVYIADNVLDKSASHNKFGLIIKNANGNNKNIKIVYNTMIAPKAGGGGAGLFNAAGSEAVIKRNLILSVDGVAAVASYDSLADTMQDNYIAGVAYGFSYNANNVIKPQYKDHTQIKYTEEMEGYGSSLKVDWM